ncbi:hypothetical protein F5Y14DRAFT_272629 [Nemania sp. NC0429]|nr:hypothetical protein F5Y14DRAFT_272629 [Nemania sp. NC0429]
MTELTEEKTASPPAADAETPRRHCWECLRRRLVCDSTRPVCNRCRTSGIVCPGYGEQQPLRWVKPGRVTARTRRRPKAAAATPTAAAAAAAASPQTAVARSRSTGSGSASTDNSPSASTDVDTDDGTNAEDEAVLFMHQHFTAFMNRRGLNALMRYDITCDNFIGLEASYTYNVEIYERCSPMKLLLGDSRTSMPLASIAPLLPASIKSLFVLIALGFQVHSLPRDAEAAIRSHAGSAIAFWVCQVVRALNEDIADEVTRLSDGTVTGILMLLFVDQQLHPSPRWRFHYSGLMKIVQLRGGVEKLWVESPHMQSGILTWFIVEVFANTTSPSHDQLNELTHPKRLGFLDSVWESGVPPVYMSSICPPALLVVIVRINHLRGLAAAQASRAGPQSSPSSSSVSSPSPSPAPLSPTSTSSYSSAADQPIPTTDAQVLLARILTFSPNAYASANSVEDDTRENWALVGRIYQSAAVLYCIISLQGLSQSQSQSRPQLPEDSEALARTLRTHYTRLLLDLKPAFQHANFKSCFLWPLVVAGACAARGTAFEQAFVADLLSESVADVGNSIPLLARKVLAAFWESGKTGWDDCFDKPYLCIM